MAYVYAPTPQDSGLGALGQVIANAGQQYSQRAREDQLREQQQQYALGIHNMQRGEQLADVKDARANAETVRKAEWDHTKAVYEATFNDGLIKGLVSAGKLPLKGPYAPEAVAAAIEESKKEGLNVEALAHMQATIAADPRTPAAAKLAAVTANPRDPKAMEAVRAAFEVASGNMSTRSEEERSLGLESRDAAGAKVQEYYKRQGELSKIILAANVPPTAAEIESGLRKLYGDDLKALTAALADPSARSKAADQITGMKIMAANQASAEGRNIDELVAVTLRAGQAGVMRKQPAEVQPALGQTQPAQAKTLEQIQQELLDAQRKKDAAATSAAAVQGPSFLTEAGRMLAAGEGVIPVSIASPQGPSFVERSLSWLGGSKRPPSLGR